MYTTLTFTEKLRLSSRSSQSVLRILLTVATFQLELPKCTLSTTLVLKSCDFPAGAVKIYFEYTWTEKLRLLVRKSRDFRARAAKTLQTDAEEKTILTDTSRLFLEAYVEQLKEEALAKLPKNRPPPALQLAAPRTGGRRFWAGEAPPKNRRDPKET